VVGMTLASLNYIIIILLFLLLFFYQEPGCRCSRFSLAFSAVPITFSSSVDNSVRPLVSKVLHSSHMIIPMHCIHIIFHLFILLFRFLLFVTCLPTQEFSDMDPSGCSEFLKLTFPSSSWFSQVSLALGLSKDDNSESCLRPTCSYNIPLLLLLYSTVLGALLCLI